MQLGYFAGITMLVGITEVEFYYLVAYLLFRNFFTNWVMWKWEPVVNLPPVLPGWGILYYLSYIFNFVPLVGIGQLAISKGFLNQSYSQACMLLYYVPTSLYSYTYASNDIADGAYNFKLVGYIFWPAALIIWAISTFTQKYPRRKPNGFDLFFMVAGIYMLYIGLSAGLELLTLRQVAMK